MGFVGDAAGGLLGLPSKLTSKLTGGSLADGPQLNRPDLVNYADNSQYQQTHADLMNQLAAQQALQSQLNAQNGIGNQNQLAAQLFAQTQGGGPNPAAAQLALNTSQNIANQNALMAGQRGASANSGLIARQAAQQGSQIQQQAVGQAAVLRAQQQLAAQQQYQELANQQVAQQLNNQNSISQNYLGDQAQTLGALGQKNNADAGITNTQQQGQNALSQQNQQMTGNFLSGLGIPFLSGLGSKGGPGGTMGPGAGMTGGMGSSGGAGGAAGGMGSLGGMESAGAMMAAHGGEVYPDHLNSIQGIYYGNDQFSSGGNVGGALQQGGSVPGQAKVKGDSAKNDTVSAMLSPGEVVLPRSVMNSKNPAQAAAQFVKELQQKEGKKSVGENDFKKALKEAMNRKK